MSKSLCQLDVRIDVYSDGSFHSNDSALINSCGTNIFGGVTSVAISSGNTAVATVSSGGTTFNVVRGVAPGSTTLTVTITANGQANTNSITIPITVTADTVYTATFSYGPLTQSSTSFATPCGTLLTFVNPQIQGQQTVNNNASRFMRLAN